MTEVTLEVLQGQSAINKSIYIYLYIFQYLYKRELPVWVFTSYLGTLRWEMSPCSLREQSPHRCAGLSVVDQRSSD